MVIFLYFHCKIVSLEHNSLSNITYLGSMGMDCVISESCNKEKFYNTCIKFHDKKYNIFGVHGNGLCYKGIM